MKIRGAIRCTEKVVTAYRKVAFAVPSHFLRELSSVGSERLPYKQRVGGSTPSAPTSISATYSDASGFFFDNREHSSGVQSACLTSRRSAVQICMFPQADDGLHVLQTVFFVVEPRRTSELRRRPSETLRKKDARKMELEFAGVIYLYYICTRKPNRGA